MKTCIFLLFIPLSAIAQTPADLNVVACSEKMQNLTRFNPEVVKVRKIINKHIHYRGTAHIMIPHRTMDYNSTVLAYKELNESDLPAITYLLATNSGLFSPANGIVKHFKTKALPCLLAGKNLYPDNYNMTSLYNNVVFYIEHGN